MIKEINFKFPLKKYIVKKLNVFFFLFAFVITYTNKKLYLRKITQRPGVGHLSHITLLGVEYFQFYVINIKLVP